MTLLHHSISEGDDVEVTFPSGREVEGRVVSFTGRRAVVSLDATGAQHTYPTRWLKPWGHWTNEEHEPMPRRRTPQLNDDVCIELKLPPQTEEWADDLLGESMQFDIDRTPKALFVSYRVGGNCDGISNLRGFLAEVEEALSEGDVSPMEFTVRVWAEEPKR